MDVFFCDLLKDAQHAQRVAHTAASQAATSAEHAVLAWQRVRDAAGGWGDTARANHASARFRDAARRP